MKIRIITLKNEFSAELLENRTAKEIFLNLPLESSVNRWGDEIYFDCPVDSIPEDMKQDMDIGDIGYWIEGGAVAIFFGPTPASRDERPRAAVPVVHIGSVEGDPKCLGVVSDGEPIRLEALEDSR